MKSGAIGEGARSAISLATRATREIPASLGPFESTVAAWDRRVQSGQSGASMTAAMSRFGRQRALEMYAGLDRSDYGGRGTGCAAAASGH